MTEISKLIILMISATEIVIEIGWDVSDSIINFRTILKREEERYRTRNRIPDQDVEVGRMINLKEMTIEILR